jgi:hypothetical protein
MMTMKGNLIDKRQMKENDRAVLLKSRMRENLKSGSVRWL